MNTVAKERLEREFRKNPPGDLTDSSVVRRMCKQNDEETRPVMERMERLAKNSLAQAFTKIMG